MTVADRFELEQQILQCWHVTDDIKMFVGQTSVTIEDWQALAQVYEIKFQTMFELFETLVKDKKIL